jgi:hypothetical protein
MKLNNVIASGLVAAVLALEAWTLKAVVDLKVEVAALSARVAAIAPQNKTTIAIK